MNAKLYDRFDYITVRISDDTKKRFNFTLSRSGLRGSGTAPNMESIFRACSAYERRSKLTKGKIMENITDAATRSKNFSEFTTKVNKL